jgi:hypothetical protein
MNQTILQAMITEQTCGEACWCAREDICRCSCGGKNHGVLRDPNGVRPERTSKIDNSRYTLIAVGNYLNIYNQAKAINQSAGYRRIDKVSDTLTYHYSWSETDKGAPARVKPATQSQIERWPELTAWRDNELESLLNPVYLLWSKV